MTVYREGRSGIPRARAAPARALQLPVEAVPIRADDGAPAERWGHQQTCEPAPMRRAASSVASGVQSLRMANAIGDAEVVAAERLRKDYLVGVEGVREASGAARSGSADAHDVMIARAMAVGGHREIAELLGTRMTAWLISFLVEDFSFVAMADKYWPGENGRKEIKGGLVTLLVLLTRLYAALDRKRKPAR